MKTSKIKRSGDHYLHEIDALPEGLKKIKHNGSFVFAVGEASNHNHTINAPRVEDFDVYQDESGRYYFVMNTEQVKISHFEGESYQIADHKTIPSKKRIYKQVRERELDFSSAVERKVLD